MFTIPIRRQPVCPDPQGGCNPTVMGKCVLYSGNTIPDFNIFNGDTLDTSLNKIHTYVSSLSVSVNEEDPIWNAEKVNYYTKNNLQTPGSAQINWANITGAPSFLTSYTETDPIWNAQKINYYTKTDLQTSGQAAVHWDNLTNVPTIPTGSDYIKNQLIAAQSAGFWINSQARMDHSRTNFRYSDSLNSCLRLGRAGDAYFNVHLANPGGSLFGRNINMSVIGNTAYFQALGEVAPYWDEVIFGGYNNSGPQPHITFGYGNTGQHRFANTGNVLIGTFTDDLVNRIQVNGNIRISALSTLLPAPSSNGVVKMMITDEDGKPSFMDIPSGGGGGSVTFFSAGSLSSLFTTSVSNPGTTPALSFNINSQNPNLVFAAPNGISGAPSFRTLVEADIPQLSISKINWTGTTAEYIRGDGSISTLPAETDPVFSSSVAAGITSGNILNWDTAYNDRIVSIGFSGTTTKILTLTQQDGGTLTASFTDNDSGGEVNTASNLGTGEGIYSTKVLADLRFKSLKQGSGILLSSTSDEITVAFTNTAGYITANQTITLSGDISGSGTTAITTSIGNNKVTLAMMAQVATASFLGRTTAATGNVEVLTATQATALLNVFSSTLKGVVPASGGGTTNFLRADGSWAAPPGGGGSTTLAGLTDVSLTSLANNQLLKYNSGTSLWENWTPNFLTANQTITLSGDISGSGTTAITTTIGPNKVTLSMMAQIATASFMGRVTAATGNVEVLTGTQATTLLDVFSSTLKGLAPASGGGTSNFLRADGTWAAPVAGMSNPMSTLGDLIYEDATPAPARLAGNTSTTKKFLTQTGNGTISAVPSWGTISAADVSGISGLQGIGYSSGVITLGGTVTSARTIDIDGSGSASSITFNKVGVNDVLRFIGFSGSSPTEVLTLNASSHLVTRTLSQLATDIGALTAANNGLSVSSGTVKLGGSNLLAHTTVPMNGFDMTFSGGGSFTASGAGNHLIQSTGGEVSIVAAGLVNLSGGMTWLRTKITTSTTLTSGDFYVAVDATAGDVTVTLPTTNAHNRVYIIKRLDSSANGVTIVRSGTDTIEGAASLGLSALQSVILIGDALSNYEVN